MAKIVKVEGFDAFLKGVEDLKKDGKTVFVLFSGSKKADTGESWCPDCVVAEPIVVGVFKAAPVDVALLYVDVGSRDFWKDQQCVFRKDSRTKLKTVPTLVKYGTPQRLEEEQCAKKDLVSMLLED